MRTDSFFDQQRAVRWTLRHYAVALDSRGADQRAATRLRRPHNRLALGDRSFRAGPVRERMVALGEALTQRGWALYGAQCRKHTRTDFQHRRGFLQFELNKYREKSAPCRSFPRGP
jgi:hypothetical protein